MTGKIKATAIIWLISLSTLNSIPSAGQPFKERPTMAEWIQTIKEISNKYGMNPNEMLAVAEAEGSKDGERWYFGKVGRYYLPWGIHQYVVKERGWNVRDWRIQTEVAIKALAYHKRKRGSLLSGLRCYNKSCNPAYINRVVSLAKKNKKEGVFK